jgi:hypothetical protein
MTDDPPPPERLWKYRPWNGHAMRMIVEGEVYFTPDQQLNDPFEFQWFDRFPTSAAEIDDYAQRFCVQHCPDDFGEQLNANYMAVKAWIESVGESRLPDFAITATKFSHGVLCLSETNRDILMWSHYADSHRGVCIAVRPDRLEYGRLLPVDYCEKIPIIDAEAYLQPNREPFVTASRSKALDWRYEQEWRTIAPKGPRQFRGCVDQVVIGCAAPAELRQEVLAAVGAADQHINVFEAFRVDPRYVLDIRPIDTSRKH